MSASIILEIRNSRECVRKQWDYFKKTYLQPFSSNAYGLVDYRLYRGLPIRAFFVRKVAQYLLHESDNGMLNKSRKMDKLLNVQLPFIVEMVISIQYYHNHIYDRKNGGGRWEEICAKINESNQLERYLEAYIHNECGDFAPYLYKMVKKNLIYVDTGQRLEKERNNFQQFNIMKIENISFNKEVEAFFDKKLIEDIEEKLATILNKRQKRYADVKADCSFFQTYIKRIYLTCAALYIHAGEMVGTLLNVPERKLEKLLHFIKPFGLMRQIVNDNCDFIPAGLMQKYTSTKVPEDAFADLKNGNVTLPMYLYLVGGAKGVIFDFLKEGPLKNSFDKETQFAIFEDIQPYIFDAMLLGKEISRQAQQQLEKANPAYPALSYMNSIAVKNRFYKFFEQPNKTELYYEYS